MTTALSMNPWAWVPGLPRIKSGVARDDSRLLPPSGKGQG
jgi:hypothetical protein